MRGYKEEGTTTTPLDMAVLNDMDRFHLVKDVADRVRGLGSRGAYLTRLIGDKLIEYKRYIERYGYDMPGIRNWRWGGQRQHRKRHQLNDALPRVYLLRHGETALDADSTAHRPHRSSTDRTGRTPGARARGEP